ncbi:MAG: ABC transporter permease subunit [Acidobacteria bacterium]|nr:ABC transporter permease subunit [Acidobacteriota bacterium]
MTTASILRLCASQELVLAMRARATQIFAVVFAALSLVVSASGYILSGGSGVQDFARTASSLTELVLFVVPMMALLVGTTALSPDQGAAELLFSQPVARRTLMWGRLLGLFAALVAAQAIGFGISGLIIFSQSGDDGVTSFLLLGAGSVALTAVSLSAAAAIASGAGGAAGRRCARGLAIALSTWFVAVVLYDLVALGLASLLRSGPASRLLITATLANPVDAIRTGVLLGIQGTSAFGSASLALLRFTGGTTRASMLIVAAVIVWIAVPALAAARRLERADI